MGARRRYLFCPGEREQECGAFGLINAVLWRVTSMKRASLPLFLLAALVGFQPVARAQEDDSDPDTEPAPDVFYAMSIADLGEYLFTNCAPGTPFKDDCMAVLKVVPGVIKALADTDGIPAEEFEDYDGDVFEDIRDTLQFLKEDDGSDEDLDDGDDEEDPVDDPEEPIISELAVLDLYEMQAWGDTQCADIKSAVNPGKCCTVLSALDKMVDGLLNSEGIPVEDVDNFEADEGPFSSWVKQRLSAMKCGKKQKGLKNGKKKDKNKGNKKGHNRKKK